MIKVLLVMVGLMFSTQSFSFWGGEQQQMVAPKSVQQLVDDKKTQRCAKKLQEYNELVEENSDSDYYRYLLDNWKRDCQ